MRTFITAGVTLLLLALASPVLAADVEAYRIRVGLPLTLLFGVAFGLVVVFLAYRGEAISTQESHHPHTEPEDHHGPMPTGGP